MPNNPSHSRTLARLLQERSGMSYQAALARIDQARQDGVLPRRLDQHGLERAADLLCASPGPRRPDIVAGSLGTGRDGAPVVLDAQQVSMHGLVIGEGHTRAVRSLAPALGELGREVVVVDLAGDAALSTWCQDTGIDYQDEDVWLTALGMLDWEPVGELRPRALIVHGAEDADGEALAVLLGRGRSAYVSVWLTAAEMSAWSNRERLVQNTAAAILAAADAESYEALGVEYPGVGYLGVDQVVVHTTSGDTAVSLR